MKTLSIVGTKNVETNREEFVAFVMSKVSGVTVSILKGELDKLGAQYTTRMTKEVLAGILFDELEKKSAAEESPVAETNPKEAYKMDKDNKGRSLVFKNKNNEAMLDKSKVTQSTGMKTVYKPAEYQNVMEIEVNKKINEAVGRYLNGLGKVNNVRVISIIPFAGGKDMYDRVGYVIVQVPRRFAYVKIWNRELPNPKKPGKKGVFEWKDLADYNINQFKSRRDREFDDAKPASGMRYPLEYGSGLLKLAIRVNDEGQFYVSLPKDADKENPKKRYDVIKTTDIRFRDASVVHNHKLEGAVMAAVLLYWDRFVKENLSNRHDFEPDCHSCQHATRFFGRDALIDDEVVNKVKSGDMEVDMIGRDNKSTAILPEFGVDVLAQVGKYTKSLYCTARGFFPDELAVQRLNKADQKDRVAYEDEDGNIRYQTANQLEIDGEMVNPNDYRHKATAETCRNCPFYTPQSRKKESQVVSETIAAREEVGNNKADVYVPKYWTARARATRQIVQTFVGEKWVTGFPYEFNAAVEEFNALLEAEGEEAAMKLVKSDNVRIKGIGGLYVYLSQELLDDVDVFVQPETEEYDAELADFMKKINMIYTTAFRRNKMTQGQIDEVFTMAATKPEGLTTRQEEKWENALFWLKESVRWAVEREEAMNRPAFEQRFFGGIVDGAIELHVEEVMGEKLFRASEENSNYGSIDELINSGDVNRTDYINNVYDDLEANEFARYLDESALDRVYDVIQKGASFTVVGGTAKDKELAVGALQFTLNREVARLTNGVVRSVDPKAALTELKVHEDVINYIKVNARIQD